MSATRLSRQRDLVITTVSRHSDWELPRGEVGMNATMRERDLGTEVTSTTRVVPRKETPELLALVEHERPTHKHV